MRHRSATTTALGAVVLLCLGGCPLPGDPAAAPPAVPEGVSPVPSEEPGTAACVVRTSFPPSGTRPAAIARRKLIAGVDLSDPAMSHWNASSRRFEGFNIDLLLAVARELWPGRDPRSQITFRAVPPGSDALRQLDPDNPQHVDVVATSLTATCERAHQVYFSDAYLDSGQTALVRRAPGIASRVDRPQFAGMEELGGRRVCAAKGTTALANLRRYRTAAGAAPEPVQAEHPIDCLVMLRQREVDAVSAEENVLRGFALMAPDTTLVTQPPRQRSCAYNVDKKTCTWFTDEPHAFAFGRHDRELTAYVNHVLRTMRGSGEWERAHERWLELHPDKGMPSPGPAVEEWPW